MLIDLQQCVHNMSAVSITIITIIILEMENPGSSPDLLVNERGHGKAVEAVRERPPQPDVVPPLALVVEAVDAVDGGALVVAPQKEEVFWVLNLRGTGDGKRGRMRGMED
eukprot:scaffold50029_cov21-Tisochrysis_lutea.AAC.1